MIACSSSRSLFFGVDCALKYANPFLKSNPLTYFEEDARMDRNKKLKSAGGIRQCQWRPVSVSNIQESTAENSVNELEDGDHVQETIKVAQVVTNNCDSTISAGVLNDTVKPMLSAEKHSLMLEVGASLIRFIKGKEGSTQKKIEEEMGVKIVFPSSKKEESIVIEGISTDCVTRASKKIQAIMDEAIESSLDYSHFISLPLAIYPELTDKLVNFQNSILGTNDVSADENLESDSIEDTLDIKNKGQELIKGRDVAVELKVEDEKHVKVDLTSIPFVSYPPKPPRLPNASDFGIDKSIFIKPTTFHLTVLMLKLWNKERVNAASGVLESISSKVIDALDNRPISIRLKGLDTMRGSLSKARVLYAPVEEIGSEGRLLSACQVIINAFVEAGLVLEKDAKQKLKLHATVMNARHRKGKRRRKNDSFDARAIFKQFGSEDWGEYLIREAHLSQRFVFDENGYYHCCASIPFPGKEERQQTD
ncbi:uncharacterized protein LOC133691620 isoform X3 [Populus nigra]|uniref:uncharacterized protein LOC133691620 isoform X3 n=1 Tax=Populus nigra TaxID=3691 RepID=UPI002B27261B|nr:uncharacterized protein LOC133691620 isoform X3 [Populus nigra]